MEKNKYFIEWAKKLSVSESDIQNDFNKILNEEKEINSNLSSEEQEQRSLVRLSLMYKKQLRSPATGYEGIILGVEDKRDLIAKKRKEAIEFYKVDPQNAVLQQVTDEEGNPLDTIKTFSSGRENPNYGKPLPENSFVRRIFGLAKKSKSEDEYKFFSMNLNNSQCDLEFPIMKPIKFMAIEKSSNLEYILNPSSYTKFVVDESIVIPNLEELIKQSLDYVKLSDINSYHEQNRNEYNRVAAIKGSVSLLSLEPTSIGNYVMQIEDDEDVLNLDAKSLTCWIPGNIDIRFSEGDKILVIGRTNQSRLKDDDGNLTDEFGDITLNVFGIYQLTKTSIPYVEKIEKI